MALKSAGPAQVCSRCVMDSTVPEIRFGTGGVCNFCRIHNALARDFPTGPEGETILSQQVAQMKQAGHGRKYDCVIGVSGGTDSSYLLHWASQAGLRVLAVHIDNGWNSELAVRNIEKITSKLNIDLVTLVLDWEEFRDLQLAFFKSSIPWVDGSTDEALYGGLYQVAAKEGIKFILTGANFRIEGKVPTDWTYTDARMIKAISRRFGRGRLKTFPLLPIHKYLEYGFIRGIKTVRPFYFMDFRKTDAMNLLEREYDWKYAGGHHHENFITKFVIAYYMPVKYGIDKRKVTLSALVRSHQLSREQALRELEIPPYDTAAIENDLRFLTEKLEITREDFNAIMQAPLKTFRDFPSYYPLVQRFRPLAELVLRRIMPFRPTTFHEMDAAEEGGAL
ncbi:MAG TPA: N-acetyl sugar amidotransferase [Bdellovibrionales bacterium]|nr:N-acetyl sugar amidotransferase [Bdellovibrionales bacterium]